LSKPNVVDNNVTDLQRIAPRAGDLSACGIKLAANPGGTPRCRTIDLLLSLTLGDLLGNVRSCKDVQSTL
jgi:hypothetical protein